jgi:hypothetical protein
LDVLNGVEVTKDRNEVTGESMEKRRVLELSKG